MPVLQSSTWWYAVPGRSIGSQPHALSFNLWFLRQHTITRRTTMATDSVRLILIHPEDLLLYMSASRPDRGQTKRGTGWGRWGGQIRPPTPQGGLGWVTKLVPSLCVCVFFSKKKSVRSIHTEVAVGRLSHGNVLRDTYGMVQRKCICGTL